MNLKELKDGDKLYVCGYKRGEHLGRYINLKPTACTINIKPNQYYNHIQDVNVKVIQDNKVSARVELIGAYSVDLTKSTKNVTYTDYRISLTLEESILLYRQQVNDELARLEEFYLKNKKEILKALS